MTLLAWGLLDSRAGYVRSGQMANGLNTLRWGTDYMTRVKQSFIKCFVLYNRIKRIDILDQSIS